MVMKKIYLTLSVIVSFVLFALFGRKSQPLAQVGDSSSGNSPVPPTGTGGYRDGTYVGGIADAFYGNIQVEAVVAGGKVTDVQFLQYPNDRSRSIEINSRAMPYLKSEAIQAQTANVDVVSGATDTSMAFVQSLTSALNQAK
jgi:uncharacterized protein with FMN-binding domain